MWCRTYGAGYKGCLGDVGSGGRGRPASQLAALLVAQGPTDIHESKEREGVNAKVTTIGSLLSAFLASLCCAGPLILGVLGVGVGATGLFATRSSYVKVLVPYRLAFIALTCVFLIVGFLSVYRRQEGCPTDPGCSQGTASRIKLALWVVTIFAIILILLPELVAISA